MPIAPNSGAFPSHRVMGLSPPAYTTHVTMTIGEAAKCERTDFNQAAQLFISSKLPLITRPIPFTSPFNNRWKSTRQLTNEGLRWGVYVNFVEAAFPIIQGVTCPSTAKSQLSQDSLLSLFSPSKSNLMVFHTHTCPST